MSFLRSWWEKIFGGGCCPAYAARRLDGPKNQATGTFSRILTLNVPAGDYVVVAKCVIVTSASGGSDVHLVYDAGAGRVDPDRTNQPQFLATAGGSARSTHPLEAVVSAPNGASIWLEARSGATWSATDSKIIAVQVRIASDQEVTS